MSDRHPDAGGDPSGANPVGGGDRPTEQYPRRDRTEGADTTVGPAGGSGGGDGSGRPMHGWPGPGETAHGQPGYGQPGYGRPEYGQTTYGQPHGRPVYAQPGYGPPGAQPYGAPGYGYGYAPPPTNTMAILALVFAFVFAPVAIVLGVMARKEIARTGEQGHGLATAGMWLGIAFTALFVIPVVLFIVFGLVAAAASAGGI